MSRSLWSVLMLLPSVAQARPLSLDEALARAVVAHPDVVESGLLHDQAVASVITARASFDPVLSASVGAEARETQGFIAGFPSSTETERWDASLGLSGTTSVGTSWTVSTGLDRDVTTTLASLTGGAPQPIEQSTWATSVGVSVTQDVLTFLRASAQRNDVVAAKERLDQAEVSMLRTTQSAVAQVAEAWWSWWAADATREVSQRSLAQSQALVAQTQAWFEEGEVAKLEVDRVRADMLAAERNLLTAEADVRSAADALLVQIGLDLGQPVEPGGSERAWSSQPPELDATVEAVLAGNLDLALARLERDAARRSYGYAKDGGLPSLDLTGAVGVSTLTNTAQEAFSELTSDMNNPYGSLSLGLTVPLGGRAARSQRQTARAALSIEEVQFDAASRELTADARAAVDGWLTAQRGVELAEARVSVAQSTEDGERARVEEGTRRLDQLLDAVEARQAAEADEVSARVELARAELTLARLEGRALAGVIDVQ